MHEKLDESRSREAAYSPAKSRDWTKGNITRTLLSLAWPMVIANTVNVLGPTVDTIWVGMLGTNQMAAVGVAATIVMLVNAFLMGIFTGLRSMVSRYIGAKDPKGAVHVAQQSFIVALILGVTLAIIGILLDRWMLGLLGLAPEVIDLGSGYMRINFIGMIIMSMRFCTDGIMQASGDTVNPLKLAVVFRLVHIALSPFLVFGWWIFPEMGIEGTALANLIAQFVGTVLGFWILANGRSRIQLSLRGIRLDLLTMWRLIKIGIPASVMGLQMQFGQLVLTTIVVPFGTAAVAAHTLCQRMDMMLMMPLFGIGAAAGVLAGQNLGARQPDRAERSGWVALAISQGVLTVVSLLIISFPQIVVGIFNHDPGLTDLADNFVRISALSLLVSSFTMVLQSCVSGAGDTIPPLIIGVIVVWAIQVPLSIVFSNSDIGIYGVRWGMTSGAVLNALAYTIYFKMGRWKLKRVY